MINKRPIRLFVDCHSLDAGFQGVQTFLRELYKNFTSNYNDVEVYYGTSNIQKIKEIFPSAKDQNVILYKNIKPSLLRYFFDIPSIIKKYEIDFAHFQYIAPGRIKNCVYIVTLHDIIFEDYPFYYPWFYKMTRKILFRKSFLRADIRTTVSLYSRNRIATHYGIDENEIYIIPNAVDPLLGKSFQSKMEAASFIFSKYKLENFILCVSRIEPRKNHVLLLKAYLDLQLYKKNIPLVFIGNESVKTPALIDQLAKLEKSVRSFIHWFPQVSQEDLQAFYMSCKLFVFPSFAEGFGFPPLEAAICMAPVLCSSATAMHDFYFFDHCNFNPEDEKGFISKLEEMIDRSPGDESLIKISETIKEKYSAEKSARILYQLIKTHS